GAKVYTPLTLKLYDWWVLGISNQFAWLCPTKDVLLPHFTKYVGNEHLDIGVGTGFYLTHLPQGSHVSLMDINISSLNAASHRAGVERVKDCIQHDVFKPFPKKFHHKFDSISMFYLLHCLPGTPIEKSQAIANARDALSTNGVLYGATVLGEEANHNCFGKKLMDVYNAKGIFSNKADTQNALQTMLSTCFYNVEIMQIGKVALFWAQNKI
ncbi:TPA: class I SAM-dependent methyltransferase, partial [Yersinia enterocolitica]|nr:class I SAM-dependent methyltransferase [Yersinia enterocolitica]